MSKSEDLSFNTTLEVRDTCLCLHVRRAARAVARHFDEALRPVDLTNGQFSLLMSLNRPEPASMASVASVLAMDRTTLTANLKPLVRRGLVDMIADEKDKRSRQLALTPAGRSLLGAALPLWRRAQASAEELIGASDANRLRADLCALS